MERVAVNAKGIGERFTSTLVFIGAIVAFVLIIGSLLFSTNLAAQGIWWLSEYPAFIKAIKNNPKKSRKLLDKFVTAQILYAQKQLKKLPPENLVKLFAIKNKEVIEIISTRKRNNTSEPR